MDDSSFDSIELSDDESAVSQLEATVLSIINNATSDMKVFLSNPGFGNVIESPFMKHYNTASELAKTYIEFQPCSSDINLAHTIDDTSSTETNIQTIDCVPKSLKNMCICPNITDIESVIDKNTEFSKDVNTTICDDVDVVSLSEVLGDSQISTTDLLTVTKSLLMCLPKKDNKEIIGESNQKVKTLQSRWFKSMNKKVIQKDDSLQRNDVTMYGDEYFRILCVFTKTYNKWRITDQAQMKSTTKVFCMKVIPRVINNCFNIPETPKYLHTTGDKLSGPIAHMILE